MKWRILLSSAQILRDVGDRFNFALHLNLHVVGRVGPLAREPSFTARL